MERFKHNPFEFLGKKSNIGIEQIEIVSSTNWVNPPSGGLIAVVLDDGEIFHIYTDSRIRSIGVLMDSTSIVTLHQGVATVYAPEDLIPAFEEAKRLFEAARTKQLK